LSLWGAGALGDEKEPRAVKESSGDPVRRDISNEIQITAKVLHRASRSPRQHANLTLEQQ
jgi:hypothetical protein